ncbi:MAG: MarR family transcriptional regulator [bacterium]|nr:MarR family transcriptional regulator [bacterium]
MRSDPDQIKEFFEVVSQTRRLFFEMHCNSIEHTPATALQARGLMIIEQYPGLTVSELAERFMMSSASITQYLNRLTQNKLINKKVDAKDRRISRIYISAKGKKEIIKIRGSFLSKTAQLLEPITKKELATLIALNKKILMGLKDKKPN